MAIYNSKWTGTEIDERLGRLDYDVNPNLLDNWYFVNPVNQRGVTSGTSDYAKYQIDRWYTSYNRVKGTFELTDGGFRAIPAEGDYVYLLQKPENPEIFDGKTITASVLFSNGDFLFGTEVRNNGSVVNIAKDTAKKFYIYINADNNIGLQYGSDVTVSACKLEFGDHQTLAHQENGVWVLNEIPNYAEELAKCQRFYQRFNAHSTSTAFGSGIVYSGYAYFSVPTPVALRTAPSIEFSDLAVVTDAISAADAVTVHAWSENNVKLRCAITANNGAACVLQSSALTGYIGLSADL